MTTKKKAGRVVGCFSAPPGFAVICWNAGNEQIVPCVGFVLREFNSLHDCWTAILPLTLDDHLNSIWLDGSTDAAVALVLPDGIVDELGECSSHESLAAFREHLASTRRGGA